MESPAPEASETQHVHKLITADRRDLGIWRRGNNVFEFQTARTVNV
jgi:hypothetical protein